MTSSKCPFIKHKSMRNDKLDTMEEEPDDETHEEKKDDDYHEKGTDDEIRNQ